MCKQLAGFPKRWHPPPPPPFFYENRDSHFPSVIGWLVCLWWKENPLSQVPAIIPAESHSRGWPGLHGNTTKRRRKPLWMESDLYFELQSGKPGGFPVLCPEASLPLCGVKQSIGLSARGINRKQLCMRRHRPDTVAEAGNATAAR